MSHAATLTASQTLQRHMRRSATVLGIALALAACTPAAADVWRTEAIPSDGVVSPLGLAFDAQGRGVLSWEAFLQERSPQKLTAIAVRAPAGGWSRAPDLSGITWGDAQVDLYGHTRALLVARQVSSVGAFNRARLRVVYAFGRSDGTFGALHRLEDHVGATVSAVNGAGDAIVAWSEDRAAVVRVSERAAGRAFSVAQTRSPAGANGATVAINARGDRVLAWWRDRRIEARVRRAGHDWGRIFTVARWTPTANTSLHALVSPGGRVTLAWGQSDVREGQPVRLAYGVAVGDLFGRWHAHTLERSTVASFTGEQALALPVADGRGFVSVVWSGRAGIELARVVAAGPQAPVVLSGAQSGTVLDDAAGGPGAALAAAWTAGGATYAAVRHASGALDPPDALTPAGAGAIAGSRVAFQPLTGEPVVAVAFVAPGGRGALQAAIGAP